MEKFLSTVKKTADILRDGFFEKLFACWLFAATGILILSKGDISLGNTDILNTVILFAVSFISLTAVSVRLQGIYYPILTLSVMLFSSVLLFFDNSIYTFIATGILFALSCYHYISKRKSTGKKIHEKYVILTALLFALLFFGSVTAISVIRQIGFMTPNFDFGIFCNIFHNMKESFRPLASCERDKILSHFAVHLSPALYILLPFYFIFPSPVTVAVLQTAAVFSGMIPFMLLMKLKELSPKLRIVLSVMYLANCAFSAGCFYDFHENCLLVPFLMWMFFFYEKKKYPLMLLFALLTLTVKEDAFVYVLVFAAYIFLCDRNYRQGIGLALISGAYFLFACHYIDSYGTGIMSYRFENMIEGEEGLFGVIKTVLFDPQYTVRQIFFTEDASSDKLFYFIMMMAPLAFIPFFTKKKARLILVLPILLNLLTLYTYQYDITFQYSFGISALLMYASILNISEMKPERKNLFAVTAAGLAVMLFSMTVFPALQDDIERYSENKAMYDEMTEVLTLVPEDASVAATTYLVPHLADRTEIYEAHRTEHKDVEFLVLDMRPANRATSQKILEDFQEYGFVPYDLSSDYIHIYGK